MNITNEVSEGNNYPVKTEVTFGMWWLTQVEGEYFIRQAPNKVNIFGRHTAIEKPQKIFGDRFNRTVEEISSLNPKYRSYLDNLKTKFAALVKGDTDFCSYIIPWYNMDKKVIWMEDQMTVISRDDKGLPLLVLGSSFDITHSIMIEERNKELFSENTKLIRAHRLAIKSGKVMVWYLDSDEEDSSLFFYGNDFLINKLGLTKYENDKFSIEEFNKTIFDQDKEGKDLKEKYFKLDDKVESNELDSYEKLMVKHQNIKTKEIFYLEHNFEVEKRYPNGQLMIRGGFMNDVTSEVQYKKLNEYLINYDKMTGLRNRNSFEKFIVSDEMFKKYSLIIADLDGLKFINDAFGHLMGDNAIAYISQLFIDEFRKDSEIFRIGGDEFAIISRQLEYGELDKRVLNLKEKTKKFYTMFNISINISLGFEIVKDEVTNFSEAFIEAENFMYRRKLNERNSRKSKTMETVLETLNQKTEETKEHCDRIGVYAVSIMKKIGYNRSSDLEDIKLLCQVHDVGKITIAEEILSKPGKLSHEEYEKIKSHSEAGYKIVRNIVESDRIAQGVLYHHERVDGKGYPFGLVGDDIPLFARVISICDSYDVMITGRKYCKAISKEDAILELKRCRGTQFDKNITDVFISILQQKK